MKKNKIHIISAAVLAIFAVVIAACGIFGQDVTVSKNPTSGEYVTVTTHFLIQNTTGMGKPGDNSPSELLCAVLVPSIWEDFEENAEVTCSSKNISVESYGGPDFTDEKCVPISGDEILANSNNMTMSAWYAANVGFANNNYGSMTWHFFKSEKTGYLVANLDADLYVKVKFKAGPESIDFNFCTAIVSYLNGVHSWWYPGAGTGAEMATEINITGGSTFLDYIHQPTVSTTPMNVRYGDVFSVNFVSQLDGEDPSALYGENEVYLNLIAVMPDGSTKESQVHNSKTLMVKSGDKSYYRYIYPKELLGLKQSDEINTLYVNFENADRSKKVSHSSLPGFPINLCSKKK